MSTLQHKIDFVALISVTMANSNGDPLDGNRPRTDYNGYGEISDVCIKRKIRNRMQDMGYKIFVQSEDHPGWDGHSSLESRAKALCDFRSPDDAEKACKTWLDVRSFGQVFALSKEKKDKKGVSVGVRGPVSIHTATSISPIDVYSMQITKSVNGLEPKKGKRGDGESENSDSPMSSDRMGMKHFVRFGLYEIKGSINVQLAEKTGFSEEDAQVVKECLRTLFVNDASSARPDGSMEVYKLFWWEHNCKDGQYSSAKVHRSVKAALKSEVDIPSSVEDYDISVEPLEGLEPEILEGL